MTADRRPGFASAAATKRAHRRDEVGAQLETATRELLADGHSFGDLSVDTLAAAASISRSTFYLYFPGKADLVRAFTEPIVEQLTAAVTAWSRIDQPVTRRRLSDVLGVLTDVYRCNALLIGALVDMTSRDAAIREHVARLMSDSVSALSGHIVLGQESGAIEKHVPATETASWLLWMIERGHRQLRLRSDISNQEITESLVDVVWHTLYAHPSPTHDHLS
jgi:TetR/AcrR family transcriptional regulator, ethionamide resistance regulator